MKIKQHTNKLHSFLKYWCNFHRQGAKPNIFIFSTPRSGSTWLMELMLTQNGFKACNEPFNLRMKEVAATLEIQDWDTLYSDKALPRMESHITAFSEGKLKVAFKNRYPWQAYYRLFTDRMVFKILHAGHEKIDWFIRTFDAQVVYMTRHPLPVALSRTELPRLSTFINSEYSRFFSAEQIMHAKRIEAEGSHIQKAVLDWCLHNAPAVKLHMDKVLFVTYEQLVLDPEPVVNAMSRHLDLEDASRIIDKISAPSGSVNQSTRETAAALASKTGKEKAWLIEKWRTNFSADEEQKLMDLLPVFELDIYRAGSYVPAEKYWLK